jgi:carbon storage regulator CsrA
VTVVRVAGGQVRLGIEAPADIHIQREEIIDRPRFEQSCWTGRAKSA